ncbi:hypothetical protein VVATL9824_02559 [Vibrio vulnificus]|nr:hypothetical protein VVATL9824_02559 [Vibrio vulnificus]
MAFSQPKQTVGKSAQSYNKAFKSDSQRLAFSMSSLGFVFTVVWFRLGAGVAHTLMRRYVFTGK